MNSGEGLRLFTAEEATRTLPLVSRIATDIARENELLHRTAGGRDEVRLPELRRARVQARSTGTPADLQGIREEVARSSAHLESLLDELLAVGCMLHEPTGVIDFRSMLDGRPVALCWTLGDTQVRHWHEPGRSHDDRQQLPDSLTVASTSVGS